MRILNGRELQYLLLIAALPVLGFQFGLGSQVEQFTLIRRLADPGFAPHDFYVDSAAVFGPRFYYSLLLSRLTTVAPLPVVILFLTFVTNFALAATSFDAARRHLGATPVGAAIAGLMVVVNSGFALGLAAYLRFESFQPASPAIALALIGFSLLLAGRRLGAATALAVSALLHPLIGVETAVVAYGACGLAEVVRHRRSSAVLRAWLGYVPSGLLFAAAVFAAWVLPGLGQRAAAIPDAEFFSILPAFRAPHHYLVEAMPTGHFLKAGLFALVTGWLILTHLRGAGLRFAPVALAFAAAIVLLMCAASVLLVDVMHLRAFATAQLFRMLLVLKWVGLLFFAVRAATWLKDGRPLGWIAATAPIVATGEGQPGVMAAAMTAMEFARRQQQLTSVASRRLTALLLLVCAAGFIFMLAEWKDLGRAIVGAAVFVAFFGLVQDRGLLRLGAAAMVAGLIALGLANRVLGYDLPGDLLEPAYSFDDIRTPAADIARWAKVNTPPDSIWVTPPDFETFRLLAERAIVVDFTSVPFEDAALREWRIRMRNIYGEVEGGGFTALGAMTRNYKTVDVARLREAARAYGATYAVLHLETPWLGAVLYRNDSFKAVRLAEVAP